MYEKLLRFNWVDWMLVTGIAFLTIGIGLNIKAGNSKSEVKLVKAEPTPSISIGTPTAGVVTCEISGEVIKPGVYKVPKGSRWDLVMAMAGGLAWEADREWVERNVNRAKVVGDGEKIFVPKINNNQDTNSKKQTMSNDLSPMTKQILGTMNTSEKVNLNTAGMMELNSLPGIGPALAQRMIDYREKNGGFKDINEVKLVSGIGDKLYEKIKELIEI